MVNLLALADLSSMPVWMESSHGSRDVRDVRDVHDVHARFLFHAHDRYAHVLARVLFHALALVPGLALVLVLAHVRVRVHEFHEFHAHAMSNEENAN